MKILLFGKNGQVGWELQRALAPVGDVVALGRGTEGGFCGDLANPAGIAATVNAVRPDVIVNAAAYTAVDKAEAEPDEARRINADGPALLANAAAAVNALFVHYSTDYVFDGSGASPWREDDRTNPLSVYGRTKLEGERAMRQAGCAYLIFRTSWVYAARGNNFAKTMLRLAQERESLSVIDDQIGAPTGADLIADVTAHAIVRAFQEPNLSGVYHLAAGGETSWHSYARFVLEHAARAGVPLKASPDNITPIPSTAYSTAAKRPLNSRLQTSLLRRSFALSLPSWQDGVSRMLTEILGK
ncbi:dTDP-4-dehydrorhamnose reductase [Bordetella bronchialis]|uniref:dTDP-4-dehydrorhamnose reductase n=1 Tax=Bordetella bronchialis TaxID=463025 RepID=A0A193G2M1_9BORD|nr:dTDP-4-dehydrorhamnose reductase [Bordetella bronchialis]ANN69104.1 dTDP-4-dehydrorhamnose reductase [Bordetella bronchialis]ANN74252.1 dTDP-4-dehydrorhamnose reductase [Bordetella bronchialis]